MPQTLPTTTPITERSGIAGFLDATQRHFGLFFDYFSQYAKVRVSYRGDFFISLATSFAATIFALSFVVVLFQKVPQLAGWRFEEVLFLYGFSLIPYGIFNIISLNLYEFGSNYIIEGKFDRVLLRPISSLFQVLFETFRIESLPGSRHRRVLHVVGHAPSGPGMDARESRHAIFLRAVRRHHLYIGLPHPQHSVVLVRRSHRRPPARVERDGLRSLPAFDL